METINNLWNMTRGKTQSTIKYIENLEPSTAMTYDEEKRFDRLKADALKADTANKMLEMIEYNLAGKPGIYYRSFKKSK